MTGSEFWYTEGGSRAEGRCKTEGKSKRWWLPSPQVPRNGLSDAGRKKLMNRARLVYQVLKATKSINEGVLSEMPLLTIIKDALPKVEKSVRPAFAEFCPFSIFESGNNFFIDDVTVRKG